MKPLSSIKDRLRATLKMCVITEGNRYERSIAESQVNEAIDRITALESELAAAKVEIDRLRGES